MSIMLNITIGTVYNVLLYYFHNIMKFFFRYRKNEFKMPLTIIPHLLIVPIERQLSSTSDLQNRVKLTEMCIIYNPKNNL